MPCCGKKRKQSRRTVPSYQALKARESAPPPTRSVLHTVYFEYVGQTGLTALGPISGRRYRFDRPGAKLAVDKRDAPSLAAVPNLRQVRNPPKSID